MFRIKRFNVVKTSTVAAVMYMVVVAIFVVPFALLFGMAATAADAPAQFGFVAILGIAISLIFIYGLLGWVVTAVACLIYNVVAGWIGGIEVEIEPVAPPQPPPAWIAPTAPPAPPAAPSPPTPV